MNALLGFDPLLFLGITDLKDKDRNIVSQKLLDRISQYIAIRIVELPSEDDLKNIDDDPKKLFATAKEKIPDLDSKTKSFQSSQDSREINFPCRFKIETSRLSFWKATTLPESLSRP